MLPLLHLGACCGFSRHSVRETSVVLSQNKPPEMYVMFMSGPTSPLIHSCRATLLANLANSDFDFFSNFPTPLSGQEELALCSCGTIRLLKALASFIFNSLEVLMAASQAARRE